MAHAHASASLLGGNARDVRIRSEKPLLDKPFSECNNKEIGRCGEEIAAYYLEESGLEVVERNWRCNYGEVDIVADDGGRLVLVEVKTRVARPADRGLAPEEAVGYRKRLRYEKLALVYLSRQTRSDSVRFDVIAVKLLNDHDAAVRHIERAYEWGV